MWCRLATITVICSASGTFAIGQSKGDDPQHASSPIGRLEAAVPNAISGFMGLSGPSILEVTKPVEDWVVTLSLFDGLQRPEEMVQRVAQLVAIKRRIDRLLNATIAMRVQFTTVRAGPDRRAAIRSFLQTTSALIDLSGRMRYLLYDAIYDAAVEVAATPSLRDRLIDILFRETSSIGAAVMAEALFDPPPDSPSGAKPASHQTKLRMLELIAVTGQIDLLPVLAEFINESQTSPELALATAETIRRVGLPQNPRSGQDPTLPQPSITAQQLYAVLRHIDPAQLDANLARRHSALLKWLMDRVRSGIDGDRYRLGQIEVQAGDWLLMRNPSPYNRFTDLSPGLFTHVGVITLERAMDGIRRMVVVDLPEQGTHMQTTNIDAFVRRTLHYIVLRHDDRLLRLSMGERARAAIGRPTRFDLNFRTERVVGLRGQPLDGKTIHTYCAGLLLLCAQETSAKRSDFFPIPEFPAGGRTEHNLKKLGLTFGENFISPTGALFSSHMMLVGRREPMYEPRREVEEAVYDHFADRLMHRELTPSPNLIQALRLSLAEASERNPLLAQAIADAAGVDPNTDLISAAKAVAVVETLDQIASGNSSEFLRAREALWAGSENEFSDKGYSEEKIAEMLALRRQHERLSRLWETGQLSPRELRVELVEFYSKEAKRQLDERFFRDGVSE